MGQTSPTIEVPLGGCLAVPATSEPSRAPTLYGICATCHGPASPRHATCWSCRTVGRQLPTPLPPVVPVFLLELGSPVHRALVGYKAGVTPSGRAARIGALGDVLGGFLAGHAACLLGSTGGAVVVPVPSSVGGRPSWHGRHPLGDVCERAVSQAPGLFAAELLRPGARPPRRLDARAGGYEVERGSAVAGVTAIVVDDMFVSGSRSLSAAAALTSAGAHVAAVVPLGRLVRPDHNAATEAFFAARSLHRFDPSRCAVCPATGRHVHVVAWPRPTRGVSERLAA